MITSKLSKCKPFKDCHNFNHIYIYNCYFNLRWLEQLQGVVLTEKRGGRFVFSGF